MSAAAFWLNAVGHLMNRQTRERVRQKAAPNILDLAAGRGTGGRNLMLKGTQKGDTEHG